MGFDGLPSQQPIHKEAKSFSENSLMTSDPALQGDGDLIRGESHKKRITEEPDCKDIFEEKLKMPGTNRDAIMDLLKKPNPLFVKHLQGLQESSSSSRCSHLLIPKLSESDPKKYQAKHQNVEGTTSSKHQIGSKKTHDDGSLNQSSALAITQHHLQESKIGWEEEKEGTNKGTSRIVILKPNYAMAEDARNCSSSKDSARAHISGSRKPKGHMSERIKEGDYLEKIDVTDGVEVSASRVREAKKYGKKVIRELSETTLSMKERESRESARKFNGEVQEVFSRMRTEFPSYVKVIPGTGGLHDLSKIDSASESDVMKMTSYDSTESFVSRQAKKRLLERWRRAQRHELARTGGKGITLREMLCISEDRLKHLDMENARWDTPLGISSADGWKDMYSQIKPRSRSLPPGTRSEMLNAERADDKLLLSKEERCRRQSDRRHRKLTETATSRSSKRKSQSRHRRASDSHASVENHINHDDIDLVKKNSPEENTMVPPTPIVSSTFGTGASTTLEYYTASSVSSDACYPNVSKSMLKLYYPSHSGQEHSNPKHLVAEGESSGILKEAGPSAISVLKVPTGEDLSSVPESFKQLSAEIHDLRKQLSLLRSRSQSNFDAHLHINNDFASEGSSLSFLADEIVVSEYWQSFYIADVLIECGLYDADIDACMPNSKGPYHPLGPWVFHNLEKKYCDETSAPKYERMLLFDRIRAAVLEISRSCKNPCPWVKPMTAEFGKLPKCKLRNEVQKLLDTQEAPAKVIDRDTFGGDLRSSIDMLGIKFEKSITDDLLTELVMELKSGV
ncbi:hypothetical protein DCAR_0310471 [Daucus carota subsp. sativus]|uniref:DUF4378 domain-containing protein n=2 Tax=Daucus carota subsp. sativus TaxID=79200 RepID=A0AAF0WMZ9_DAUCS|nr:hypothetical protein DCAR_0310471 [Daucus carota subsp. sativus]